MNIERTLGWLAHADLPRRYDIVVSQAGGQTMPQVAWQMPEAVWSRLVKKLATAPTESLVRIYEENPFVFPQEAATEWGYGSSLAVEYLSNGEVRTFPERKLLVAPEASDELIMNRLACNRSLFWLHNFLATEDDYPEEVGYQLLDVTLGYRPDNRAAFPIGATISPKFRTWLDQSVGEALGEATLSIMADCYNCLLGRMGSDERKYKARDFSISTVQYEAGWCRAGKNLSLSTPGADATGFEQHHQAHDGKGFELGHHNVDHFVQQWSLLTGLALLATKARESG